MESPCECDIETPGSISHVVSYFIIIIIIIIIIKISNYVPLSGLPFSLPHLIFVTHTLDYEVVQKLKMGHSSTSIRSMGAQMLN